MTDEPKFKASEHYRFGYMDWRSIYGSDPVLMAKAERQRQMARFIAEVKEIAIFIAGATCFALALRFVLMS